MDETERLIREKLSGQELEAMLVIAAALQRIGRTPDEIRATMEYLFPATRSDGPRGQHTVQIG